MCVILYFRVPKKFCHLADSYLHEDQSQSRYKIYFKNLFQISAAPKFKFLIYFDFFWYFRDIFSLQSYKQYWKKLSKFLWDGSFHMIFGSIRSKKNEVNPYCYFD